MHFDSVQTRFFSQYVFTSSFFFFISFSVICPQHPPCKLSSYPPQAKIDSQEMCRNIGKFVTCSACTIYGKWQHECHTYEFGEMTSWRSAACQLIILYEKTLG